MAADVNQSLIRPPLPATGLLECPVDDRGESDKGVPLLPDGVSAACISDIKGQKHLSREKLDYFWNLITKQEKRNRERREDNRDEKFIKSVEFSKKANGDLIALNPADRKDFRKNEVLKLYEGLVLVRKIKEDSAGDEFKIKRSGGTKKKITTFSKRSRLNMIKHLAMMKQRPAFWHDLTYPDDVMEGLNHKERKVKSSDNIHELKRWMERKGIKAHGAWKREWVIRKSGILKGTAVPHFHNVDWVENADDRQYLQIYYRIAEKWLKIIGTQGEYEAAARKVLYHEKSFRFIKSQKQMRKYMQKYISKDEEFVTAESIGRSWGLIGDPIEENPEAIEVNNNEMVLLKRMLRKFCKGINKKVKYGLNFCLSHQWTQFFVLIERQTVFTMLEQIRSGTVVEGVPF